MSTEPLCESPPVRRLEPVDPQTSTTSPRLTESATETSHDILSQHSRSFSWAAQLLPADRRDDAAVVYAFCRIVDDSVDEADSVGEAGTETELARIRDELRGNRSPRELVEAFLAVVERRDLDLDSAIELIDGCASDLGDVRMETDGELIRYCYRVAGTVGLMMSSILGVAAPQARHHAIDLGVAMQLTNICRDVAEDARRGRVYLPEKRLREAGISSDELLNAVADNGKTPSRVHSAVAEVVGDLLDVADEYYRSADEGMHYIPFRSRPAILVASRVYRAIGVRLRAKDCRTLERRAVVSTPWKAYWVLAGLFSFLSTFRIRPERPRLTHDPTLHDELTGLPGAHRR